MAGKRPMSSTEKRMLSEEYKVSPNYAKFDGPVQAKTPASKPAANAVRNRADYIDEVVESQVKRR